MDASNYRIIGTLNILSNAYERNDLVIMESSATTYIEVYSPQDGIYRDTAWTFRRWYLSVRNVQLAGVPSSGYIYVRLMRELDRGEVIFSRHNYDINGTATDDPSIEPSTQYYYVHIGTTSLSGISIISRNVYFNRGNLSNDPERVEMGNRLDDLDDSLKIVEDGFGELNSMDYMTASDKKQKASELEAYKKERESIMLRAMRYGVNESTITDFLTFAQALIKMVQYIVDYKGNLPLVSKAVWYEGRRLGIKYTAVTEKIDLVEYHQYDIAYVLKMGQSRPGWLDTNQVYEFYRSYKDIVNEEIEQIIAYGQAEAMSVSAASLSAGDETTAAMSLAVGERDGKKYIQLVGRDGAVVSELDAALLK